VKVAAICSVGLLGRLVRVVLGDLLPNRGEVGALRSMGSTA
jgi:hypothetical protein